MARKQLAMFALGSSAKFVIAEMSRGQKQTTNRVENIRNIEETPKPELGEGKTITLALVEW